MNIFSNIFNLQPKVFFLKNPQFQAFLVWKIFMHLKKKCPLTARDKSLVDSSVSYANFFANFFYVLPQGSRKKSSFLMAVPLMGGGGGPLKGKKTFFKHSKGP